MSRPERNLANEENAIRTKHWPLFPWLPMKRYRGGGQWPELGLLYALNFDEIGQCRVYNLSLHTAGTLREGPTENTELVASFPSIRAMLEAGWEVD